MTDVSQGSVVVTGAARGIGAAIATRLAAERRWRVGLSDVDDERGCSVASGLGAEYRHCDATDESEVAALLDHADALAPVRAVYANAGAAGAAGPIADLDVADWRRTQELLLTSAFLAVKHGVRGCERTARVWWRARPASPRCAAASVRTRTRPPSTA